MPKVLRGAGFYHTCHTECSQRVVSNSKVQSDAQWLGFSLLLAMTLKPDQVWREGVEGLEKFRGMEQKNLLIYINIIYEALTDLSKDISGKTHRQVFKCKKIYSLYLDNQAQVGPVQTHESYISEYS